jgi:hypothetical protein
MVERKSCNRTFGFLEYQSPLTFDVAPDPVRPIMVSSFLMSQAQVITKKPKEYGMNKSTPFTGDQTKIRQFL